MGAEALKQNKVSLSEVDEIMDQLDEVLTVNFYNLLTFGVFDFIEIPQRMSVLLLFFEKLNLCLSSKFLIIVPISVQVI